MPPIHLLFTGDFCPINRVEELALRKDFSAVYNDFIDVIKGNDLNITDLECPLTLSDSTRPKTGPYQKAHPETVNILSYAEFKLVAMANNHIMDYGSTGAMDTLKICHEKEIHTVGIGINKEDASMPCSFEIKNKRIAFLNYADNEFLTTPDGKLTCNPLDAISLFYDLKSAKDTHDYVFVIVHAGNEFYELPSPRTKKLYRYMIDNGADAVISHHTHAYSGYEVYRGKPIFYGLGNFIYDWPGKINSKWNRGYVVRMKLSKKIDFDIIPLKQCNEKPGVFHLSEAETIAFSEDIIRLNRIISDDLLLEKEFKKYCHSVFPMYDAFIEPHFGKYIASLRKRGFFPRLLSRKKRLFLLNLTRCDSHRDVLIRMLKLCE